MRTVSILVVPLLLLVVLVSVVLEEIPVEAAMPAEAQVQLRRYIAGSFSPDSVIVESFARARRPWQLSQGLRDGSFGDSSHFYTNGSLSGTVPADLPMLAYPPKDAWCVVLSEVGSSAAGSASCHELVVMGLHIDMYVGPWMTHRLTAHSSAQACLEELTLLGCDINLNDRSELNLTY